MKVLYIVDAGNVGGAARSFVEVLLQMKEKGVEPVVFNSTHNDLNEFLDKERIENYSIGHNAALTRLYTKSFKKPIEWLLYFWKHFQNQRQVMKELEKSINFKRIELIHTNSARNDIGCYISRKYHIPHIVHFREFGDLDFNCTVINPYYYKMMNHYAVRFITISDAVQRHWIKKGLDASKMQTIYNGIHWQDISTSPDSNKKNANLRLVITGGVFPTKGQHLVVDALCLLPEDMKRHFTLDVIGWYGEQYVEKMKQKAIEHGIAEQVHFLGARNDVPHLLGNYEIGLMCSKAEGFGRTTAEYMHARLGVIASDSGANPELIEDEKTGLLFRSGDAQSLCDCLKKYYNNREMLIEVSKNAQKKALSCYTDSLNAENIYKVYSEIIG